MCVCERARVGESYAHSRMCFGSRSSVRVGVLAFFRVFFSFFFCAPTRDLILASTVFCTCASPRASVRAVHAPEPSHVSELHVCRQSDRIKLSPNQYPEGLQLLRLNNTHAHNRQGAASGETKNVRWRNEQQSDG